MSLGCEHVEHMPLEMQLRLAALVDAVQYEQRTPRNHRLPQHAVERVACVLDSQICVDPVPRGGKGVLVGRPAFVFEQPSVQGVDLWAAARIR